MLAVAMEGYHNDPNKHVRIGKRATPEGKDDIDPDFGIFGQSIEVGQNHGIRTLEHGVSFFNLEMWPETLVPTSALIEYEGPPIGPTHEKIREELKQPKN
jgi:hypothetical protein